MKELYITFLIPLCLLILFLPGCSGYYHHMRPSPDYCRPCKPRYKKIDPSQNREQIEAVHEFAPVIRHGAIPSWWKFHKKEEAERTNFITRFDYDGNNDCSDNEENLMKKRTGGRRFELEATVYYSIVETVTHRFVTYHFYHPTDCSVYFPNFSLFGLAHENDGENIQVVVKKSKTGADRIELVAMESHIGTKIYFPGNTGPKHIELNAESTVEVAGNHPLVFVGSGKHPISNGSNRESRESDIFFHPPDFPDPDGSPPSSWDGETRKYTYKLKPVYDSLWMHYVQNRHLGDDGIMNGCFEFRDSERGVEYGKVPRHYNSDYISCVFMGFKSNAGILPFAFDLPGKYIKKGRLFFNPASNYKRYLDERFGMDTSGWSEDYTYNLYLPESVWKKD